MKHVLLLLLVLLNATVLDAQTRLPHVFLHCEDEHGAYLRTDSLALPTGVCVFIAPPKIPFYTPANFDEEGTNACIHSDVAMTLVYKTDAFSGFHRLTPQVVEAPETPTSLVLIDAESPEQPLYAVAVNGRNFERRRLSSEGDSPEATWLVDRHTTAADAATAAAATPTWSFYNRLSDCYLGGFTPAGETLLSERPVGFRLDRATSATDVHPTWRITDPTSGLTRQLLLRRHTARPFYTVRLHCIDNRSQPLRPDSTVLVEAGRPFVFQPPAVEGMAFRSADPSVTSIEHIAAHTFIECTYRPATAILPTPHSTSAPAVYRDLTGRRVVSPRAGIYVLDGKRVVVR